MLESCNNNVEDIKTLRGNRVISTTTHLITIYIQLGLCSFTLLACSKSRMIIDVLLPHGTQCVQTLKDERNLHNMGSITCTIYKFGGIREVERIISLVSRDLLHVTRGVTSSMNGCSHRRILLPVS